MLLCMKRIATVLVLLVLAAFTYVAWPYGQLVRGFGASDRVERDLVAGYPAARDRTEAVAAFVRRQHPELGRATNTWQEVRCGINDLVTQFPTGEFAQECSLRSVWMVPVGTSRWDSCSVVEDLFGGKDPEGDATASLVRTRTADLVAEPGPESMVGCPVLGPEPRDSSSFIYGGDRPRLVSGGWPGDLRASPSWKVFEVEVFLSSTQIGCRPALGFCTSPFGTPQMDAVERIEEG